MNMPIESFKIVMKDYYVQVKNIEDKLNDTDTSLQGSKSGFSAQPFPGPPQSPYTVVTSDVSKDT
jgi:hypothetical protein